MAVEVGNETIFITNPQGEMMKHCPGIHIEWKAHVSRSVLALHGTLHLAREVWIQQKVERCRAGLHGKIGQHRVAIAASPGATIRQRRVFEGLQADTSDVRD